MEVVFPAMGEGRYGFIVDVRNDAGEVTRVLDGYVGYDGPEAVEEAVEDAEEETILVYMNGEQRRAVMAPTSAAHRYAAEAEKAMAAVGEIDKKLELAEKLEASFSGKMADFVVPNKETGTWWVGGVDSLLPWEGVDGVDGAKVKRIEIDSTDKLPESGETCNGGYYYYVTGRQSSAALEVGQTIYVYAEDPSYEGLLINDFVLGNRYETSLHGWVRMINAAYDGVLMAEYADERHIKLTNIGSTVVSLHTYRDTYHDLYLKAWWGYKMYGWVERLGVGRWVEIGVVQESTLINEATLSRIGGVVLTNSLLGSNDSYVLPTKEATRAYIDGEVSRCAKKSALTELVRKDELEAAGYLKPDDVVDYVTEAQVDSKIEENLSGVALQSSFVVLSETEYNLLPDTAEGVFYFTYAD
jgi:hypothetical protein